MRVLDSRLVGRARAVRALLVADAVLGIGMALLVLMQAVLLARIAARARLTSSRTTVVSPPGWRAALAGAGGFMDFLPIR